MKNNVMTEYLSRLRPELKILASKLNRNELDDEFSP